MGKAGALAAAMAALAVQGCSAPAKPAQPGSPAQLLALTHCPLRIGEARAWVSRFPGQPQIAADLPVSVNSLNDATALIMRSEASTTDTLVLEMRISETSTTHGRIAYREAAPNPIYRRVVLACHGAYVDTIQTIEMGE